MLTENHSSIAPASRLANQHGPVDPEALIEEAQRWERRRRYRRAAIALAVIGAVLVAFGIARGAITGRSASAGSSPLAIPSGHGSPAATRLYGVEPSYAAPSTIARVDPKTLEFVGKRLRVSNVLTATTLSPDRRQLLLLNGLYPSRRGLVAPPLEIVNLGDMHPETRIQARLDAAIGGRQVVAAFWPTPDRILALTGIPMKVRPRRLFTFRLLAIDPRTGAREWTRDLGGMVDLQGVGMVAKTILLVVAAGGADRGQHAEVLSVSSAGVVHSSTIQLGRSGYREQHTDVTVLPDGSTRHRVIRGDRTFQAQLVTTGGHSAQAYVLTGGGRIYTVDAATARTTLHVLAAPNGAPRTSPPFLFMSAAPLGTNIVVSSFFSLPNGGPPRSGIYLIDTSTWKARLVDSTTPAWYTSGDVLVSFTSAGQFDKPTLWTSRGTGIRIYDSSGTLRHHLEGTQAFTTVERTPLYDFAVVPTVTPRKPVRNPAEHHEAQASMTTRELLFEPNTGTILGTRTVIGPIPTLIQQTAGLGRR